MEPMELKPKAHPLKAKLKKAKIAQWHLARYLEISQSSVWAYLNSARDMPLEIEEEISKILKK